MAALGDFPRAADELRTRLKWFLLGRVAVVSGFVAMVAVVSLSTGRTSFDVQLDHLLMAVVAIYAISALSALLVQHLERPAAFAYLQIAFDVALVTGVIWLTGGLDSPFAFLFSLPIVNGAVLLFGQGAAFAAVCAALAYDGLLAALASSAAPVDGHGPAIGLRVASTNITFALVAFLASVLTRRLAAAERLLAEKDAERNQLELFKQTLARAIGSTLVTTDNDGRITAIDTSAEELTGRAQTELLGKDIGTIFAPLKLTPSARLSFLQSSAASEPVEFAYAGPGGAEHLLRCVGAPLANTFGHPIGALYVLQNVTPLRALAVQPASTQNLEAFYHIEVDAAGEAAEAADGLVGTSPAIVRLRSLIGRIAQSDTTVLLTGESGTGKEVVARAIHARGRRGDKRFVAVNCGAIPENLIESELFGHVRGAFTGAVADRPGCFRSADHGTLFLDEIGELPLHLQVKLLRVLQERTFRPVGSETNVAVDVRIIAATNRDLATKAKEGTFREDLFYRLNVITVDLPPLRERREDIPLLTRHFLRQFAEHHGRQVNRFSVAAGRLLLLHNYPGNVRELENIVEHAVALCDDEMATEEHLPQYLQGEPPVRGTVSPAATAPFEIQAHRGEPIADRPGDPIPAAGAAPPPLAPGTATPVDLERDLAEYEKAILLRALEQAGGVKKRAAALLGINYRSLRHRLQKYGLGDGSDDGSEGSAG